MADPFADIPIKSGSKDPFADIPVKTEPEYQYQEPFAAPSFAEGEMPKYGQIAKAAYLTAKENIPMIEKGMMKGPEARALKAIFPERMGKVEKGIERSEQDIQREMAKIPPGEAAFGMAISPSIPYGVGRILPKVAKTVGKAGEKVVETAGKSLPGSFERASEQLSKIGTATDKSQLGSKLSTFLEERLGGLRTARQAETEKLKGAYYKQAMGREDLVSNRYNKYLEDQLTRNLKNLSREESSLLGDSMKRLAGDKSVDAMEKELRRLKAIQFAPKPLEGVDAIPRLKAGDMAENLEKILNRVAPKGKVYREAYEVSSEPINLFDIALGKKATKGATERVSDFKAADPANLPNAFFETRDSVKKLRALAQDDKFVVDAAKEHIANELTGLDGKQARAWYKRNELWLDELKDISPIKTEVRSYVDKLASTQGVVKTRNDVLKALGVGAIGYSGYQGFKSVLGI